jgi:hypothetical protein
VKVQSEQDQLFEDLKKAGLDAQRVDKERAELLNGLMKHKGWQIYWELLNNLVNSRAQKVLAPGLSVDGMVALEFEKGAMSGLIMARDLPSVIVQVMNTSEAPSDGETET